MKLRVDRKTLITNIKLLKALSARSIEERFTDVLVLGTVENGLRLTAGFGQALASITIPATVEEQGECNTSYKLLSLLKAARDEELMLSHKVALSVTGKSGFRASLNEKVGATIPINAIQDMVDKGINKTLELNHEELDNLIDISNVFAPMGRWKWIEVTAAEGNVTAVVQGSDEGSLDHFPMQGAGDDMSLRLHPDYLSPLLSFCGSRVKIQVLTVNVGFVLLTDPDNTDWFATIVQIGKNSNEAYEPTN